MLRELEKVGYDTIRNTLGAIWFIGSFMGVAYALITIMTPFYTTDVYRTIFRTCSVLCHQIDERCYEIAGRQLPFCARCLGLYAGVSTVFFSIVFRVKVINNVALVVPIALFVGFLDIALKPAGTQIFTNNWRLLSGLCLGLMIGGLPILFLKQLKKIWLYYRGVICAIV